MRSSDSRTDSVDTWYLTQDREGEKKKKKLNKNHTQNIFIKHKNRKPRNVFECLCEDSGDNSGQTKPYALLDLVRTEKKLKVKTNILF